MAVKQCPSRLVWFALGASSLIAGFTVYAMLWSGILGVPTGLNPAANHPTPEPVPKET